ncbi:MAG: PLP-dependent aminotransferase family protein [Caulobacteraceae bacterium]|nr:PLP-dependent aminotransferase family protein [Caulobacteraceae bacterium]
MEITTSSPGAEAGATAALLSVVLDRAGREPLGRQLYLRVRDLILLGRLAGGARLPSSRRLADDLGVSRTVTLAAYDQLTVEGYLEAQRGSGHYVKALKRQAPGPPRPAEHPRGAAPAPVEVLLAAPRGRPFDSDAPASDLFPTRLWARMMARGWRREGLAAAGLGDWAGLASLRGAIAGYLRGLQGIDCAADQVVITAGNADALQLITRGLGGAGAQIWVEDPGHVGARQTLRREGLKVVPVPVDAEGLDVAAGRRLAPRARFALVTPARQFPTGAPLSLPRRVALIDWAHETDAVVIADDYDSELRFAGRPVAALSSLDRRGVVLSIGSFSRVTFPGLRLGYIVGSAALIAPLVQARAREGSPVATGAQPALAEFIGGGGLAKHLRGLRRRMGQRRDALADALRARLGEAVTVEPQEVGQHLVVTLGPGLAGRASDVEIAALATARGLSLDPLSNHAAALPGRQGFLLGYAGWDEAVLLAGVEALAKVLAQVEAQRPRCESPR